MGYNDISGKLSYVRAPKDWKSESLTLQNYKKEIRK